MYGGIIIILWIFIPFFIWETATTSTGWLLFWIAAFAAGPLATALDKLTGTNSFPEEKPKRKRRLW